MKIKSSYLKEKILQYNSKEKYEDELVLILNRNDKKMQEYFLISTRPYINNDKLTGEKVFNFLSLFKKKERNLFELKRIEEKDYIVIHKDNVTEEYMTEEMSNVFQLINELSDIEKVHLLKRIIDDEIIPLSMCEDGRCYCIYTEITDDNKLVIEL